METVMSEDRSGVTKSGRNINGKHGGVKAIGHPQDVEISSGLVNASPPSLKVDLANVGRASHGGTANEKSDSEAETVVLSGKDEASIDKARKTIKHERLEDSVQQGDPKGVRPDDSGRKQEENDMDSRPSLKRKRVIREYLIGESTEAANSSNLSSTISSPALEGQSSRRSGSESDRSRSSPPFDEVAQPKEGRIRKRRQEHRTDDHARQQRGKSDLSSENGSLKERRETRSATHHEMPGPRSESPILPGHKRAHSTQSNLSESHTGHKPRKAPPPLLVERRRKASEDAHGESDDSSSVHSHRFLHRITLIDNSAISPAKMSHKKNRDKNGRTLLARACALDESEAALRLKERPQDLDIPDNAGNTPLQIASLEGKSKIVHLLLDAGCDINCKNIDMETPLIDAVENGHLDVVRMLLKAGLDPRQSNAKGEEPLDLVNPEMDHYDEIRAALVSAKEKDKPRRSSEDHNVHSAGQRDNDTSSVGASAASPTESLAMHSARSPPPPLGPRRRTARSQPTQDSLLWINATPERLREAAGIGDLTIVDHILKMRPDADSESVLAAAKGGHEIIIELLIAIGKPDPDPEPLRSSDYKPEYSTPMLAAIGRGNVKVIKLLLNQPGFDPTRRLYKGLAYYEIAKVRQGSEWQEEYNVLKEAFDKHMLHKPKKANLGSPRKTRVKRPESHKSNSESSSPLSASKSQSLQSTVLEESKEGNKSSTHKTNVHRHQLIPEVENRDFPAVVSDRETEPLGPPKSQPKSARSTSDVGHSGTKQGGPLKPRRKLLSRNDLDSDDTKRRASLAEASSTSSQGTHRRKSSDSSKSTTKVEKEAVLGLPGERSEAGKKRPRISVSPQASIRDSDQIPEIIKKKKRRRVDSQGNAITYNHQRPLQPGPAMVANMIPSPDHTASPTNPPGAAPVAFMGASPVLTSPTVRSPTLSSSAVKSSDTKSPLHKPPTIKSPTQQSLTDTQMGMDTSSSISGIDQALQQTIQQQNQQEQTQAETSVLVKQDLEHDGNKNTPSKEESELTRQESQRRQKAEAEAEARAEAEAAQAAQAAQALKAAEAAEAAKAAQAAQEKTEEKARVAREEEEARLESQRQAEEAARQLQLERDEEEVRAEKRKREEEVQRRRVEQEKLRREELERKRTEAEERERLRQIRIQEEEEQHRREALPNGLRRAAELSPEEARSYKEIVKWLPLHTATTREIDPTSEDAVAEERWVANVQVAPILAITDLDLSHYATWPRLPTTPNQRMSLWRQCRNQMSQAQRSPLHVTWTNVIPLDAETRPKFFALHSVFWIRLADFLEAAPRYPHLAAVRLRTRPMLLHEDPWGRGSERGKEERQKRMDEGAVLVNGFR